MCALLWFLLVCTSPDSPEAWDSLNASRGWRLWVARYSSRLRCHAWWEWSCAMALDTFSLLAPLSSTQPVVRTTPEMSQTRGAPSILPTPLPFGNTPRDITASCCIASPMTSLLDTRGSRWATVSTLARHQSWSEDNHGVPGVDCRRPRPSFGPSYTLGPFTSSIDTTSIPSTID